MEVKGKLSDETNHEMETAEQGDTLNGFASQVLRPPKRSEIQDLLANELAMSLFSADPLQKMRHIFEAFGILNPEEQKAVVEKEDDIKRAERYHSLVVSFLSIYDDNLGMCYLPLSFPSEGAYKYFDWLDLDYDLSGWYSGWEDLETLKKTDVKRYIQKYLGAVSSFLSGGNASHSFILSVRAAFIRQVLPFAHKIFRGIFENFISQDVWERTLLTLRGQVKRESPMG